MLVVAKSFGAEAIAVDSQADGDECTRSAVG